MPKQINQDVLNLNEARELYIKLSKKRIGRRMFNYYITGYGDIEPKINAVKKSSGWVIARDEIIRLVRDNGN